jgi:hypothetical protein
VLSPTPVPRAAMVGSCAPSPPVFPCRHGRFRDLRKVCRRNSVGRCPSLLSPDAVMLSLACTALERCSPPIRARQCRKYMRWLSSYCKGYPPVLQRVLAGAAREGRRCCEVLSPELRAKRGGAAKPLIGAAKFARWSCKRRAAVLRNPLARAASEGRRCYKGLLPELQRLHVIACYNASGEVFGDVPGEVSGER